MTRLVPDALREELVARITEEADEADWDFLPQSDKTARLALWMNDPTIGGVLRPLVGGDAEVRVWIKEVALKLRSRRRQLVAAEVISALYGAEATIEPDSEGIKPPHCVAIVDSARRFVCWGADSNARNLFWAALNAPSDDPRLAEAVVAFIARSVETTPAHRRARMEALACRCGLRVTWLTL